MAMHLVRRTNKQKQLAAEFGKALPYKQKPLSLPVAEDTAEAERVFGDGTTGGRYNMILVASIRAYDLLMGATPMIPANGHRPTVLAMLEVEAGKLTRDYVPKFTKPKNKK